MNNKEKYFFTKQAIDAKTLLAAGAGGGSVLGALIAAIKARMSGGDVGDSALRGAGIGALTGGGAVAGGQVGEPIGGALGMLAGGAAGHLSTPESRHGMEDHGLAMRLGAHMGASAGGKVGIPVGAGVGGYGGYRLGKRLFGKDTDEKETESNKKKKK